MILLQGVTKPAHGICLETREWKRNLGIKYRGRMWSGGGSMSIIKFFK